jgi:hypothetical protein
MQLVVSLWKGALRRIVEVYDTRRGPLRTFFPALFVFFVVVNIACYWLAMFTAFPELTSGDAGWHYFKVQFPVGILGALFDSLSFFATVWIVRRALKARSSAEYIAHLSLDLVIAVLATMWVVFVFTFSGWIINLLAQSSQSYAERSARYNAMLVDAAVNPIDNVRNIYFGLVMGISSALPTVLHLSLFVQSTVIAFGKRIMAPVVERSE